MGLRRTLELVRVSARLGARNVARVAAYRLLLRAGAYRRLLPPRPALEGPFFTWPDPGARIDKPAGVDRSAWEADADRVLAGEVPVFSNEWVRTGFPPAWDRSVLSGVGLEEGARHWTRVPDFGLAGGDVKGYWETSRYDGLLRLALGWITTHRPDLLEAIEAWLSRWCASNPANVGAQWKCGQETGIRLMHTLVVQELLQRWGGARPAPALAAFVQEHCARIAPTMLYAVAQENNHGTSEAAALWIGGEYLTRAGAGGPVAREGRRWLAAGRRWLEDRVERLVLPDGSFSQHSVNYHRVLLDTCSLAEVWRRWHDLSAFSERFYARCRAATEWLASLTDPASGDAPNLGANDGARLLALHRAPYRDHRPSVQLATALFAGRRAYAEGPHDELAAWLGVDPRGPPVRDAGAARLWSDGGYVKLAADRAWALVRLPRYRFRPSHADPLHVDLWLDGENVLRDGGTFSYNAGDQCLHYFAGIASHNTVQFDDREPMPRLSRFLFGRWLDCTELQFSPEGSRVVAGYRDYRGATHRREIRLDPGRCTVQDTIAGFSRRAVLRWRLPPSVQPKGGGTRWTIGESLELTVEATAAITRCGWVQGWEARHYGVKAELPVLEVEVASPCTLTTTIVW